MPVSEVQIGENGQICRLNYDGEWETESEQESSDEELDTPPSEFYEAESHEFPRDVGIPMFWYNGELYFWTNRNLGALVYLVSFTFISHKVRVFARLVNETLDYLEAECEIPRELRPEGWDDWHFSFDRPIHPHLTHIIANDLQRRLNYVELVRLGRIAPRGVQDPSPEDEDVQGTTSAQPHEAAEVPTAEVNTQPSSRSRRSTGRSARSVTTRRRASARRPRGRTSQVQSPSSSGPAVEDSESTNQQEEEMVESLLEAAADTETANVDDEAGERRSLRPRSSLRLPAHLNDYVRL